MSPEEIDALVAAGVTAEQLAEAIKADMAAEAERKKARPKRATWERMTDLRRQIESRDGRRCGYCGATGGPFSLDHVFPLSRGGSHDPENLKLACVPCNTSKGAKTPDEWTRRCR